jgi:hypothetical protein
MHPVSVSLLSLIAALFVAGCAPNAAPQMGAPDVSEAKAGGASRAVAPAAPGAPQALRATGGDAASAPTDQGGSLSDRMIIRTTNLNLSVRKVSESVQDVQTTVNRYGGYVANTRYKNDDEKSTATLSVRVPSDRVENFLRDVRGLAVKVNEEGTNSQDVTEEYSDLGAQLRNQEATESQYLELMKRAQSVDEILKVQQQLTQIRGQIERTKGRIQFLERRADMTQIDIMLVPDLAVTRGAWDAGEVVRHAWEASLVALQRVAEVGITVVVFLWWLVPVALVVYLVGMALRQRPSAPAGS